jgi:hypothetical protein
MLRSLPRKVPSFSLYGEGPAAQGHADSLHIKDSISQSKVSVAHRDSPSHGIVSMRLRDGRPGHRGAGGIANKIRWSFRRNHTGRNQDLERLRQFRTLIEKHFAEHWSVDRYACQLAVSETSLNRLCR